MSAFTKKRRFWAEVNIGAVEGGWCVTLDDKPLNTPGRMLLRLPSRGLAEAVAAEWQAQGEHIDAATLPFTKAANVAIERVTFRHDAVVEMLADYAASDLLCYRAEAPEELVQRQSVLWDPWLEWAAERLGAHLILAQGVMPIAQPGESLRALRSAIAAHDPFELTALHDLITLSGSAVLGLAVSYGAGDVGDIWQVSRTDEQFQIDQWGEDAEAQAMVAEKEAAFLRAAELLKLLRTA